MGIDILTEMLPNKISKYIEFLVNIIVVIMNAAFFYLSFKFSINSRLKPTAVLGISSIYVNFSLVIGFGLIFIYSTFESIKSYKKLKMKGE